MTVNDEVAAFEYESVAVYLTTVSPIGKVSPGSWFDVSVTEPELSLAVGDVQVTTAVAKVSSVFCSISDSVSEMTGISLSVIQRIKNTIEMYRGAFKQNKQPFVEKCKSCSSQKKTNKQTNKQTNKRKKKKR